MMTEHTKLCMPHIEQRELLIWIKLFDKDSTKVSSCLPQNPDFLWRIFKEIDESAENIYLEPDVSNVTTNRLKNWRNLLQSIRAYYLDVLQEIVIMRPPNVALIARIPKTDEALEEVERMILLMLCAAVRCDRRDLFIRRIMAELDPAVQTGIMEQIRKFTEDTNCTLHREHFDAPISDLLTIFYEAMSAMENMYLDEIEQLLQQLDCLQIELNMNRQKVYLPCHNRASSVGRSKLTRRSLSAVSLGDPTRGAWNILSPKIESECNSSREDLKLSESHSVSQSREAELELRTAQSMVRLNTEYSEVARIDDSEMVDGDKNQLIIELADTKAKLRRARAEIEDQNDHLVELHDQLAQTRRELGVVKEERAKLADAAHSARHWQDEVDALHENATRVQQLESEISQLKHHAQEAVYYKNRCSMLSEDLMRITEERPQVPDEGRGCTKCNALSIELNKTRAFLTELEEVHNNSLDEMSKLREELGKLHLEQTSRKRGQSGSASPSLDSDTVHDSVNSANKLSEQLTEAVSSRLLWLESENRRLLAELELLRVSSVPNPKAVASEKPTENCHRCVGAGDCDAKPETSTLTELHFNVPVRSGCSTCPDRQTGASTTATNCGSEVSSRKGPMHFCEPICPDLVKSLQTSLCDAKEKVSLLEKERNELKISLSVLEKRLNTITILNNSPMGTSDGDAAADDAEDEADSGNKTGESTEEASPDLFNSGRVRRNKFDHASLANRYYRRKRKIKAISESDLTRIEAELSRTRMENESLRLTLGQLSATISEKEEEIKQLKSSLIQLQHGSKLLSESKSEEIKIVDEIENHSTSSGTRTLLECPSKIQTTLSPTTSDIRLRELEISYSELSVQLSSEQRMVATLRDQLVAEKIRFQQYTSLIAALKSHLKRMGQSEDNIEELMRCDIAANRFKLFDILFANNLNAPVTENHVSHQIGQETSAFKLFDESMKRYQQEERSQGDGPKHSPNTPNLNNATDLLENETHEQSSAVGCPNGSLSHPTMSEPTDEEKALRWQVSELNSKFSCLEKENVSLNEQNEHLSAQNARLIKTNCELEAEATALRSLLEGVRASENRLTTDYYNLQRLHNQLTHDTEMMNQSLKESKELQRKMKAELLDTQLKLDRLQSNADEVERLKLILETERNALKGESKQVVNLRQDCTRLRAQLDASTEALDRERLEKISALDIGRERRRQIEELVVELNRARADLEARCHMNQKFQLELRELRNRIKFLSEAKSELEEENKSLAAQLQNILGRNQEILHSTFQSYQHRISQEQVLRERLLSMQRHRQFLEDKLMDQYRNEPEAKNTATLELNEFCLEMNRRSSFVQKARAALTKRKDSNDAPSRTSLSLKSINTVSSARKQSNSMRSQQCNGESETNDKSDSAGLHVRSKLVPGSVSIFDRDPAECDTSGLRDFLRSLNHNGADTKVKRSMAEPHLSQNSSNTRPILTTERNGNPAPSLEITNPRKPFVNPSNSTQLPSSSIINSSNTLNTSSILSLHHSRSGSSSRAQLGTSRSSNTVSDSFGYNSFYTGLLPTTERSDEKLREIVVTKSIPGKSINSMMHRGQNRKILRSFSMRSMAFSESNSLERNSVEFETIAVDSHNRVMRSPIDRTAVEDRNEDDENVGGKAVENDTNHPNHETVNRPRVLLEYADL